MFKTHNHVRVFSVRQTTRAKIILQRLWVNDIAYTYKMKTFFSVINVFFELCSRRRKGSSKYSERRRGTALRKA